MSWDWKSRGEELERARRALRPQWEPGHAEAADRFWKAYRDVWPPGFFEDLERCRRGEAGGLEPMLAFVEDCPRFHTSGYVLKKVMRALLRPPRSETQTARIQRVIIGSVSRNLRVPFERVPSIARGVDSPELRAELMKIAESNDARIRERALRALDALSGPAWNPERKKRRLEDQRALTMVVTAQRTRSVVLLRRLFQMDAGAMTTKGRHAVAVGFEFAMNWGLLPDEELLAVARRIDGPEMDGIWRFALPRKDAPGERARWLVAQVRLRS